MLFIWFVVVVEIVSSLFFSVVWAYSYLSQFVIISICRRGSATRPRRAVRDLNHTPFIHVEQTATTNLADDEDAHGFNANMAIAGGGATR
jgi:hypothetical protein